ncbi:uncharacterized protein LOC111343206 [Stylophora pistillata]|nr:uncharacterized protein LOC111343206 [Stylophora pistillata]
MFRRSTTLPKGKSKQEIKERWDLSSSLHKDHAVTRQSSVDIHTTQRPKLDVHLDPLAANAVSTSEYGCSSFENSSEQHEVHRDNATEKTRLKEVAPTDVAADSEGSLLDNKPQQLSVRTAAAIEGEHQVKNQAVHGCDVSLKTMQDVKSVIEDLHRRIKLPEYPSVERFSLEKIKSYLTRYTLRFCVLVVDTKTFDKIQRHDLEKLLKTTADFFVEKVIFTICDQCPAPKGDEKKLAVVENIERLLKEKGKGLVVCLEDGKLNVEPDVLIQLMLGAPVVAKNRPAQTIHSGESSIPNNVASGFPFDKSLVEATRNHTRRFPSQEVRYNPTSYFGETYILF